MKLTATLLVSAIVIGTELFAGNSGAASSSEGKSEEGKRKKEKIDPYAVFTNYSAEGGIPIGIKYVLISPKESKLPSEDYPVNFGNDGMTFAVHVRYRLQYPNSDTGGTNNYEHVCLVTLKKVVPFEEVTKGNYGQKDISYRSCSLVFDNKIAM